MAPHSFPSRRVLRRPHSVRAAVDSLIADDLEAFFTGLFGPHGHAIAEEAFDPRVDVREGEDAVILSAELAGLERGDFEVIVDGDDVTLRGEKKIASAGASERHCWAERRGGWFSRTFRIPFEVEPEAVRCRFHNGLLTIAVPRSPELAAGARTVPVTTG